MKIFRILIWKLKDYHIQINFIYIFNMKIFNKFDKIGKKLAEIYKNIQKLLFKKIKIKWIIKFKYCRMIFEKV